VADRLAEALDALERVQSEPRRTHDVAERLLAAGAVGEVEVVALWALGRAQHELDDVQQASRTLGAAAARAHEQGLTVREAQIRMSRSVCLLADGDTPGALRELDEAEPALEGSERARVVMQRGLVMYHLGRLAEALEDFDRALPDARRGHDRLAEARLLTNRGVVRVSVGDLDGGEADQLRAQVLAEELGQHLLSAGALHNLGFLNGRRGDIPAALRWFERAADAYAALGAPGRLTSVLDADLCDVLLAAGLGVEARAAAQRAVDAMSNTGNLVNLAEARVLLARVCLSQGDHGSARAEADEAARTFHASDRATWAAFAEYVAIQAGVAATQEQSEPPADLVDRTLTISELLEAQGWRTEALHVRTFAARAALALNRTAEARRALGDAADARHRGPADLRARAWHAAALLRLAEGDRAGARRAIGTGLRVVDAHRGTLGGSELRVHASAQGADLARLGLSLALADRRPADVLVWADRWRSLALEAPPVRPPDDAGLARDLAELRRLTADIREQTLEGVDVTPVERRVGQLEVAIRHRHRLAPGAGSRTPHHLDLAALRRRLGRRILVEYLTLDGQLHAVVVTSGRSRLRSLGDLDDVVAEKDFLTSSLRRLARQHDGRAGRTAADMAHAAVQASQRVIAPLELPPDVPVVLVPTGALHGMPWPALPGLADRPLTVSPSARLWATARPPRSPSSARVTLVAGPDLPGAVEEVEQLGDIYPGARALAEADASTDAVLAEWRSAELVHLAAHGDFRADSPLFSSLRLADGPLTVYDIERAGAGPQTVVLSACDAARAGVQPGDELIGAGAALLSLGIRSVIAPILPVSDRSTTAMMVTFHRELSRGAPPATALARAGREARRRGEPGDLAAAGSFICLGADDQDAPPPGFTLV
jgi:tetratricopeptide (TPR) repeat protein